MHCMGEYDFSVNIPNSICINTQYDVYIDIYIDIYVYIDVYKEIDVDIHCRYKIYI